MFNNSQNVIVSGGHLTNVNSNAKDGFVRLQEHVAPSAFHNSALRIDPPRCHENTRQAVLQEILDWIVQDVALRTAWIAWLNGAAGAGKSAICQSIAELCIARGILVASFFFFRADPARSTINPIVATLAYQVIRLIPEIKHVIISVIEADPLIFEQSFSTQLEEHVIKPLLALPQSLKLVFVIDGVDECSGDENQRILIHTFARFLTTLKYCSIIVLFGSRAESQIKSAFRSREVAKILLQIPLDDHYLPDKDIRLFLNDKFTEIKNTHSLSHLLDQDWPPETIVQEIVDKSSGQFIFASVVMNFVSLPRSHPGHQLEIIRGLRPSGLLTPFAHLDALYRHIFSQVQEIEATKDVLAYIILGKRTGTEYIARFFKTSQDTIHVALCDLVSVVVIEGDDIRFLHASLPDFLLDQTRSHDYYIDTATRCTQLSILWFDNAAAGHFDGEELGNYTISDLLSHAEDRPALRARVLAFDPYKFTLFWGSFYPDYITAVRDFGHRDGGELYRQQLNLVTRYVKQNDPEYELPKLREEHDISEILAEIEREEVWKLKEGHDISETSAEIEQEDRGKRKAKMRHLPSKLKAWFKK